jgi:hypothetical protein
MMRVHETSIAVENQYYVFLCVCASEYVCVSVGVWARALSCELVPLLIQHAPRIRRIVPGLSGSTTFFDIVL